MEEIQKKDILFVVNPHSGTRKKDDIYTLIEKGLDHDKFHYQIVETQYAGHAEEIASEAVQKRLDMVVAVGGDGTVNEVGRRLIHTSTALGIIPCGSGNGLARHLHIPLDMAKAIETLNDYHVEQMDFGRINGRPFFCTCGVGFDAYISYQFDQAKHRGPLSYIENVLKDLLTYKPETYEIEADDDNITHKAFLVACANASQYGNNAYIAPHASLNDGMLDITIMEPFNVFDVAPLAVQLFAKNIDKNSRIKTLRCKHVHIRRSKPGVAHYDGDPVMMNKDLFIEVIPQGIGMLIGHDEKHAEAVDVRQRINDFFDAVKPLNDSLLDRINEHGQRVRAINQQILEFNKRLIDKLTKFQ